MWQVMNDTLTQTVIGCAIEVHRELGPGLLENAYQLSLSHELTLQSIPHRLEEAMPVYYKGVKIDCGYRIDILVDDRLILELKAVDKMKDIFKAQLLTYMKLSQTPVGLLINFNVPKLVDGVQRFKI